MTSPDLPGALDVLRGALPDHIRREEDVLLVGLLSSDPSGEGRHWYAAYRLYWTGDWWEELDPMAPVWVEAALREACEAQGRLLEYRSAAAPGGREHVWTLLGEVGAASTSAHALALAVLNSLGVHGTLKPKSSLEGDQL